MDEIEPTSNLEEVKSSRATLRSAVIAYRGQFEQSVCVSRSSGSPISEDLVQVVMGKFCELEARVEKTNTESEWESIEDEAENLYRLRAYICPLSEIALQGATVLSNMEQWTIPPTALETLKKEVGEQLKSSDLEKARAALHTLFKEYDEWSEYQDTYNKEMRRLTWRLTGGIVCSLFASLYFLLNGRIELGIAFAGITGTCLSVISKIPAVIVSGDSDPYHRSAVRRLATGFAASMVGVGFLLSGIAPISLPDGGTFQQIIAALSGSVEKSPPKIVLVFEIIAIVTLLGISERALTSFEEKLFDSKEKKP